jgi:hypothetical protein
VVIRRSKYSHSKSKGKSGKKKVTAEEDLHSTIQREFDNAEQEVEQQFAC